MQLSQRLSAVTNFVTPMNRVADVGCDHAYTSIYLVEYNKSPRIIAMDVNKGPLERAEENIHKYGFESKIEVRRSNGLEKLESDEVDTILIAGMGGGLIIQILSGREDITAHVKELVLQPQSEIYRVRKYLASHNFSIVDENIVKEEGKYYFIMKAELTNNVHQAERYELIKEEHFYYSRMLLERQNSLLFEFLEKELKQYHNIYGNLKTGANDKVYDRQDEIRKEIQLLERSLDYYK